MAYQTVTPAKLSQKALTTAAQVLYTVPAATRTFVKDIDACNTTTGLLYLTLYLVPNGDVPSTANMLIPSFPIAPASAGGLFQWSGLQMLNAGDTIQALGSAAGITINISGAEAV